MATDRPTTAKPRPKRTTQPKPKRMTYAKARRAVAAIVTVLDCEDINGSDRGAFEDARAALSPWYDV